MSKRCISTPETHTPCVVELFATNSYNTEKEIDRKTERETERQKDRETKRQRDRHKHRETEIQENKETERW